MAIHERVLGCGMAVCVEPMSGVKSAAVSWHVPGGYALDPADRQGLSAMWSELLFRGAGGKDSRQQADALDRLGLSRSSDTGAFSLVLSGAMLGERVSEALPAFVEMIREPRFDEGSIEPVRDLAVQSVESLVDDPHERAMLLCRSRHNPSPINRSELGTVEGLEAVTHQDVVEGWARQIRPVANGDAASVLAVAGDVEPGAVFDGLERLLEGWEGKPPAVEMGGAETTGTYHHEDDDSAQVQICLMHDGPAEGDADSIYEKAVMMVLSGGMASRLFTEVREKRGLCYSVSAGYRGYRGYGRCSAYVGTTPQRAQESLEVLVAELDRVMTPAGRVTEEEFARAMVGLRAGVVFSGESTGARAGAIASDYLKRGASRTLDEVLAELDAVRLSDVNAYLERRRTGPMTVVTLGPEALASPIGGQS